MPEFEMPKGQRPANFDAMNDFARGYVEAMFFTECHCDNPELEEATFDNLAPKTIAMIAVDCDRFARENEITLSAAYSRCDYSEEQAGRDFWFTRNHHGVGFWDRQELKRDKIGENLTAACHAFRSLDVYRGDDGRVYLG